jgi:hypothetical protein
MTTPLSLGFASAYQKIEDNLPHTPFGVSPVLRTGINDLSRGGETAFSKAYADDQMARYMGRIKSDGLANSNYLLGISPGRLCAPAQYVAPIFGEGQAYGLHGGMIDKQTQPMLAKIWANKANQLRALSTPTEIGAPAFLPSEAQVSFNAIRDEKQQEKYVDMVDTFDYIMSVLQTGAIKKSDLLQNLTKAFNLVKDIGYTMNEFEIEEFIKVAKTWIGPQLFSVIEDSLEGAQSTLVYQYISSIVEILEFIEVMNKQKRSPIEIKENLKDFVKGVRSRLRKAEFRPPIFEAQLARQRRQLRDADRIPVAELAQEFIDPEDLMNAQERAEFNGRGRKYFNSIGSTKTKEMARKMNEKLLKH